jgi:hypothetical protein
MKQELFTLREHIGSSVFGGAHSAFGHIFVVFCGGFLFCCVVLCLVPNVARVSRFSLLDSLFGFL